VHRFQHSQRQPQHAKCNRTLPGHTTTVPVSPRLGPSETDRNSDDAPRLGALPLHRQAERPPQTNLLNFDPNTGRDCSPDHQTRVPLPGHRSTHTPFPTEVESGKDHSRSSTTQCVAAKLLNLDPAGRMFFFAGPQFHRTLGHPSQIRPTRAAIGSRRDPLLGQGALPTQPQNMHNEASTETAKQAQQPRRSTCTSSTARADPHIATNPLPNELEVSHRSLTTAMVDPPRRGQREQSGQAMLLVASRCSWQANLNRTPLGLLFHPRRQRPSQAVSLLPLLSRRRNPFAGRAFLNTRLFLTQHRNRRFATAARSQHKVSAQSEPTSLAVLNLS